MGTTTWRARVSAAQVEASSNRLVMSSRMGSADVGGGELSLEIGVFRHAAGELAGAVFVLLEHLPDDEEGVVADDFERARKPLVERAVDQGVAPETQRHHRQQR